MCLIGRPLSLFVKQEKRCGGGGGASPDKISARGLREDIGQEIELIRSKERRGGERKT